MKRNSQDRGREYSPKQRRYSSPGSDYSSRRPYHSSGRYEGGNDRYDDGGRRYPSDYNYRGRGGGPGSRPVSRQPHTEHDYTSIKVLNINAQVRDEEVEDVLQREFRKYGDLNVKVVQQPGKDRIAYLNYRSHSDAKAANLARDRPVKLWGRRIDLDPVFYSENRSRPPYNDHPPSYSDRPPPYPPRHDGPPPYSSGYHSPSYGNGPPRGPRYNERGSDYNYNPRPPPPPSYLQGKDLHVSKRGEVFAYHLDNTMPEDDPMATRTLFVGNLEPGIPESETRRIFERFGEVMDVDIKRPIRGQGNAFAFIRYENLDMAHRAKCELSGQFIGKFECKIGYGKPQPSNRVWVGNLGPWASFSVLEQEFDRFGSIRKIDYIKGDPYAYVTFDTIEAAQAACKDMRGFPLGGPDKRLRVDFADPSADLAPIPSGRHSPRRIEYGGGGGGYDDRYDRGHRSRGDYDRYYDYDKSNWRDGPGDEHRSRDKWDPPHNGSDHPRSSSSRVLSDVRTLDELAAAFSVRWNGFAALKKSAFPCKMYAIDGDESIIDSLMRDESGSEVVLNITQRLRLEDSKIEDVSKRMANSEFCILLCLAGNSQCEDPNLQTRPMKNLVNYLKQKEAAGVIALTSSKDKDYIGVLYAFPACPFSQSLLKKQAPNLDEPLKEEHIMVVVVREKALPSST